MSSCRVVRRVVALCVLVIGGQFLLGQTQSGSPPASAGSTQEAQLPDAPVPSQDTGTQAGGKKASKKRDANGNPVDAVAGLTRDAVIRARDWESNWIAGIYVGKNRQLVAMTAEQRREIYLKQTLTTPEAYMKRMFAAGIDQARGVPYQWDDGWAGYAERFASREGQFIAANSLAALGNAKLGYEVRYDKCKCAGLRRRTWHAFLRNLVTYDRSEQHLRPQWALYGGAFGGGMISTAWKPGGHNPFAEGAEATAEQVGWGTLLNFFTEFSTEINRTQGVK